MNAFRGVCVINQAIRKIFVIIFSVMSGPAKSTQNIEETDTNVVPYLAVCALSHSRAAEKDERDCAKTEEKKHSRDRSMVVFETDNPVCGGWLRLCIIVSRRKYWDWLSSYCRCNCRRDILSYDRY